MTIVSFEFKDERRAWRLEKTRFDAFNLLVGLSGVGKTSVLTGLKTVRAIGLSRRARTSLEGEWVLEFTSEGPAMESGGSRAHFHLDYLKEMFQERNLRYTKYRPGHACHESYLRALVDRVDTTEHLRSMAFMVERWRTLGGQL